MGDENLRYLEDHFESVITVRGGKIIVKGPQYEIDKIRRVFDDLSSLYKSKSDVNASDIDTVLRLSGFSDNVPAAKEAINASLSLKVPNGTIYARSDNQAKYIRMMERDSVVFAIGPAGTGKTYLAVAMAIDRYLRKLIDKIILVRPVVETGETLGFLPGDILEKVDPYFKPLYDALDELFSRERVHKLIEKGVIEVAPLAYMRGRTLNKAFVILDEAQNTTSGQMKMFLTRLGVSSKAVLTGDLTQIDLAEPSKSGLLEAQNLLRGIDGIGFIHFAGHDVVRHKLVAEIIKAYETKGCDNE